MGVATHQPARAPLPCSARHFSDLFGSRCFTSVICKQVELREKPALPPQYLFTRQVHLFPLGSPGRRSLDETALHPRSPCASRTNALVCAALCTSLPFPGPVMQLCSNG